MVIFHSYVSLPEGKCIEILGSTPIIALVASTSQENIKVTWDHHPRMMILFIQNMMDTSRPLVLQPNIPTMVTLVTSSILHHVPSSNLWMVAISCTTLAG